MLALAFTLAGLVVPGPRRTNPGCAAEYGPPPPASIAVGWSHRWPGPPAASGEAPRCYELPIPAAGTWLVTFGIGRSGATTLTLTADGTSGPVRQAADLRHLRRVSLTVPARAGRLRVSVEPAPTPPRITSVTLTLARHETTPPQPIFTDEFRGPRLDPSRWRPETGAHGWGNQELQNYTESPDNLAVEKDHLAITARRGPTPDTFTSGRLNSRFAATYGHIEARIQTPGTPGLLPAFWMLGADAPQTPWPNCGEIDIMETLGRREPSTVHATIHGPDPAGRPWELTTPMATPQPPSTGWHLYTLDWWPNSVQMSFDDTAYASFTPDDLPQGHPWLYNKPYYLLLNLAVGGNWPGPPLPAQPFPQSMQVDYVRWTH